MRVTSGTVHPSASHRAEPQPTPSRPLSEAPPTPSPAPLDFSVSSFEPASRNRVAKVQQDGKKPQVNDKKDDTVAVFDNGLEHSEDVAQVIQDKSATKSSQIRQRTVVGGGYGADVLNAGANAPAKLRQNIESQATKFLESTIESLKDIEKEPGNIQVINQSMRVSPAFIAQRIWSPQDTKLGENDRAGKKYPVPAKNKEDLEKLASALGMDLAALRAVETKKYTDAGKKPDKGKIEETVKNAVLQELVDHVGTVLKNSKLVQGKKQEFDGLVEKLEKDKGILYVVAAGNDGEFIAELNKKGIRQDAAFTESMIFNQRAIVVAASTGGNDIAPFSTPAPSVDMAIDGTDIPVSKAADGKRGMANGTSVAAPQVAALITELRALGLTTPQVRTVLADPRIYRDTKASAAQEGAGIIKPGEAKKVAKELLEQQRKQKQEQPAPQTVSLLSLPRMLRP